MTEINMLKVTSKKDPIEEFYSENESLYNEIGINFRTPSYYLRPYQLLVYFESESTNFVTNKSEPIHRWSPYLEGFGTKFVENMINNLGIKHGDTILDPFAGCGTTNITAKMNGINSIGIEINPTMYFILKTKLDWDVDPILIIDALKNFELPQKVKEKPPQFLENDRQFKSGILENILRIKQFIKSQDNEKVRNLLLVAFSSILLECSNLKRAPSIGYTEKPYLTDEYPVSIFKEKVSYMIEDIQKFKEKKEWGKVEILNKNSATYRLPKNTVDFSITSPPYLNFFDYPGNYKLEMAWLEHAKSTKGLKKIKDRMIVCDNVSKGLIKNYRDAKRVYRDIWLDHIEENLRKNMAERVSLRRDDYDIIVRKYFDDMYKVIKNIHRATKQSGRLVLVVGDSLIIDVYVPTDLILTRIAEKVGFQLEKIQITRSRRSGIRRSFRLRETVTYLKKVK
ncbi:MAG: site-specific DNA-methyltransferase [Candidatus Thermoplasmatota archaeon]|nr:site-specific DNA-methyltransferase [Candidatus Thermoplasmatota archaeon]